MEADRVDGAQCLMVSLYAVVVVEAQRVEFNSAVRVSKG